ncbi:MAG: hypothetical protein Q9182_004913 [Xanthomendoza sp. 2 TL-2023]
MGPKFNTVAPGGSAQISPKSIKLGQEFQNGDNVLPVLWSVEEVDKPSGFRTVAFAISDAMDDQLDEFAVLDDALRKFERPYLPFKVVRMDGAKFGA